MLSRKDIAPCIRKLIIGVVLASTLVILNALLIKGISYAVLSTTYNMTLCNETLLPYEDTQLVKLFVWSIAILIVEGAILFLMLLIGYYLSKYRPKRSDVPYIQG